MFKQIYLGDGLYASSDGYDITLRAPRAGGDHYVVLEPGVLQNFLNWVKALGADETGTPNLPSDVGIDT